MNSPISSYVPALTVYRENLDPAYPRGAGDCQLTGAILYCNCKSSLQPAKQSRVCCNRILPRRVVVLSHEQGMGVDEQSELFSREGPRSSNSRYDELLFLKHYKLDLIINPNLQALTQPRVSSEHSFWIWSAACHHAISDPAIRSRCLWRRWMLLREFGQRLQDAILKTLWDRIIILHYLSSYTNRCIAQRHQRLCPMSRENTQILTWIAARCSFCARIFSYVHCVFPNIADDTTGY